MDQVATRTDPLQRVESYLYNNNGNLRQVTDRKNQVTAYTYDSLDRPSAVTYGDSSTTSYTYDAGDRLTQITDSLAGTITRGYDLLDRMTSEVTPEGSVTYSFDAAHRRQAMTVAGQPVVTYSYDNADRLTSITQGTSAVALAYDSAGRRASLTLPNGVVVEYAYDVASQISGLTYRFGATTLGTLTYTYDQIGNRTQVGGTWARTGLPAAMTSATYDAANQIATWAGTQFTHDTNGNVTSDGTRSYSWNARNQLVALSGGASASFAYDGVGRRREKTINGTTTKFLYEGLTFVQELSGGTPTANLLTGMSLDEVFRRTDSAGARDLLIDDLGSTVALADGAGTVQTSYTYEPFGVTSASGTSSTNAAQFTGRENDGTGLYFYRARYYSPGFQRFASDDPLGFGGGTVNLYSYVHNNPTNLLDPLGLWVRNYDPKRWVYVKPEEGGWKKLPPCSEWPGSPDGVLGPGSTNGPPWHKFPGKWFLPDNHVVITPDGKVLPMGGPANWGWPWPPYVQLPQAPDNTWIPPNDVPTLPDIRPIPGCKPDKPKSEQ